MGAYIRCCLCEYNSVDFTMKLFEVITEHLEEDKSVTTQRQYVTAEDNSLLTVTRHFEKHCEEYEEELKLVSYVADIVQHIPVNSDPFL